MAATIRFLAAAGVTSPLLVALVSDVGDTQPLTRSAAANAKDNILSLFMTFHLDPVLPARVQRLALVGPSWPGRRFPRKPGRSQGAQQLLSLDASTEKPRKRSLLERRSSNR
jgi:hypothetical protein